MEFYDLQSKKKSKNINLIFPNWEENNERIIIFSPHDDDVILGAAYALLATIENKGDVFVVIFNDGSAGYSKPELKNQIKEIRKEETINALKILGIKESNIFRFDLPDFSSIHYLGWKLPWVEKDNEEREGLFSRVISLLREIKATRLIFPNGYREHIDHTAVFLSALFDGPQVGDAVIIDYGKPSKIKTFLQYSVWAKLSPEDSLINSRDPEVRGNKAIAVNKEMENQIIDSLKEFKSQEEIISYILDVRKDRKLQDQEKYIEIYLDVDPRPKFEYGPYKKLVKKIDKMEPFL